MTTSWTISAGAERVQLNPQRQGEITFTATNQGPVDVRAVLDVLPSENADPAWFTVDQPQRLVANGGSATFLVRIAVQPDAPPGAYWLAAMVYSAEGAPEETSVISDRVAFDLTPAPVKAKSNKLLWLVPVAVMVLAVAAVLGWLFLRDTDTPQAQPTTTTAPTTAEPTPVAMPELMGMTEPQATGALERLGLAAGTVKHRHAPNGAGTVVMQSIPAGNDVTAGDTVDLEVAVKLDYVSQVTPSFNGRIERGQAFPTLSWNPVPYAARYRVTVSTEACVYAIFFIECKHFDEQLGEPYTNYHVRSEIEVDGTSVTPAIALIVHPGVPRAGHSGNLWWWVVALDDFGNPGMGPGDENVIVGSSFHMVLRDPDVWGQPPG